MFIKCKGKTFFELNLEIQHQMIQVYEFSIQVILVSHLSADS